MKLSFLLNKSLLNKTAVNSVHLLYSKLFFDRDYVEGYAHKSIGSMYYQVGESVYDKLDSNIDVLLFDADSNISLRTLKKYANTKKVGIILKNNSSLYRVEQEYKKWVSLDYISDIAIPLDIGKSNDSIWTGYERVAFFKNLIEHDTFSFNVQHHLYGLINPIEMVYYRRYFSNVIFSKFGVAFSASVLVNSIYGVDFSELGTLYYAPVDRRVDMEREYLGTLPYFDYTLKYPQLKKFFSNCDIMLKALRNQFEINEDGLKVIYG